ncbi:hypothetical protein [Mucilaginibacter boryungensis]|uniref:Uncharacterized protein n=1 Tax=Mucilaginibacter boryungensis TaxID=768480 RepID=A0ABR9XLD3_9SPHI|nr:hypothetical protein [Mucilaginibacter boryungensis]MBE9668196.1 hypothetical protein [Mucilaginibacter boryungensis]
MQKHLSARSAILALVLVMAIIGAREFYLRSKGYTPDFDDSAELWADKRAMVYEPANKATVFIGSSRIKYDMDIPTWESITGNHAIQLAMVGSNPMPFLDDLANDPKFKGKLIVDVTEVLFFNPAPDVIIHPKAGIDHYRTRTPAQQVSFKFSYPLEHHLVFLNESQFSIKGMLNHLYIPDRPGVYPALVFPEGFEHNKFDRQNRMTDQFVADTNLQNQVKAVWGRLMKEGAKHPPVSGKALDGIIANVKADIDKIKARGGQVIFTRTPSSGPFFMGESMGYPRKLYWDKLLAVTGCQGIYFKDYPAIANMQCPEFSHLKPTDAVIYTKNIINILQTEKGWKL